MFIVWFSVKGKTSETKHVEFTKKKKVLFK